MIESSKKHETGQNTDVKKNRQKLATDCAESIAGVIEEFLDWKDVYASKISEGMLGVVIFAANFKGDVFIEWRLAKAEVKLGDKTPYDDGTAEGLVAKIVWIDN